MCISSDTQVAHLISSRRHTELFPTHIFPESFIHRTFRSDCKWHLTNTQIHIFPEWFIHQTPFPMHCNVGFVSAYNVQCWSEKDTDLMWKGWSHINIPLCYCGCRLYNVEMCLNFTADCINAFALHTKSLHETKWLKCYLFQINFVVEMFISNASFRY